MASRISKNNKAPKRIKKVRNKKREKAYLSSSDDWLCKLRCQDLHLKKQKRSFVITTPTASETRIIIIVHWINDQRYALKKQKRITTKGLKEQPNEKTNKLGGHASVGLTENSNYLASSVVCVNCARTAVSFPSSLIVDTPCIVLLLLLICARYPVAHILPAKMFMRKTQKLQWRC